MKSSIFLLISLVLVSSAFAAVFQHTVHRRKSLLSKLGRQGPLKDYGAYKQRQLHGKFSNFKSTSQNIGDLYDFEYYINMTIGTPGQLVSATLNTSSGLFTISDVNCTGCPDWTKFNSSKSSTYQSTNQYLLGNPDNGVYGQDFVRLGNPGTDQLVIPNTMFARSYLLIFGAPHANAIGLGFTAENPDGVDPPIITAINSGILDYPVVTIFLRNFQLNPQPTNYGVITFGAVDTMNCDRNIIYEPLTDPNKFQISLTKAALGTSEFSGNWNASVDTNAVITYAPPSIFHAFGQELNGSYCYDGLYTIDCNLKFNIHLTIGSTVYTLTEKEMIMRLYSDVLCVLNLVASTTDQWVLGPQWFASFCNILDYTNRRIGFANITSS